MRSFFAALLLISAAGAAPAKVKTETIEYKQGNTVLEGYLAYDDAAKGPQPGVVVVHEWMGLNDYAKRRAREMAELGYVALAADIYGKGVRPKNAQEAGALAGQYKGDRPLLQARVRAAFDTLARNPHVDAKKMLAMGYCFGGTTVLELARSGAPVLGVVSFHGGLDNPHPENAKNIKGKLLVLHGAVDPFVKPEEVAAFQKEMNDAKVDYQFHTYPGTVHAFTNPDSGHDPSKGAAYNAVSDRRSWEQMKSFFNEVLSR